MSSKPTTSNLFTDEFNISSSKIDKTKKHNSEMEEDGLRRIKIKRFYTEKGKNPFDQIDYEKRSARITEPTGEVIFELKNLELPKSWSQLATDILASKYCRRSGVPKTGHEKSAKQIVYRITHTIREYGEKNNYFNSKDDADSFESELSFLLINQHSAFNSPVWFNIGLYHQYGIKGNGGCYYWDAEKNAINVTVTDGLVAVNLSQNSTNSNDSQNSNNQQNPQNPQNPQNNYDNYFLIASIIIIILLMLLFSKFMKSKSE